MWVDLLNGPGTNAEMKARFCQTEPEPPRPWSDPTLACMQRYFADKYVCAGLTCAVSSAAVQGAASASVGEGNLANHVAMCLLPAAAAGLPSKPRPLFCEGTGQLSVYVPDDIESITQSSKALMTDAGYLFERDVLAVQLYLTEGFQQQGFYKYVNEAWGMNGNPLQRNFAVVSSGTNKYGVPAPDFFAGNYDLTPVYTHQKAEVEAYVDVIGSSCTPSSLQGGVVAPEHEAVLTDMCYGLDSGVRVLLHGRMEDIDEIAERVRRLKAEPMDHATVVGVRAHAFPYTHANQAVVLEVFLAKDEKTVYQREK